MSAIAGIRGHCFTASPPGEISPFPPGTNADIYVSAANGNDANTGLSPASPVLTMARAYQIALTQEDPNLTVIHMGSGTYEWLPMPFALTILGDGAGQPGDDGFTTVATGVSAAGTNATNLTLAAPIVANAWRGLTLEWRSGAADGHRLSIRDNTATVVTPVEVAGFPSAIINPGVGSDFAILRPAVIFQTATAEVSTVVELMDGFGTSSREYYPAAVVNARFEMSIATARGMISSARARFFGVEINPGTIYLVDSEVDAGYVLPEPAMDEWATRVGLTGFADITDWIGWGVTWPTAGVNDRSWFISVTSLLRGMFVAGMLAPAEFEVGQDLTAFGTIECNGGSTLGDVNLLGGSFLQGNFNILFTCRKLLVSLGTQMQISGLQADAALTGAPVTVEWNSILHVLGTLNALNTNGNGMTVRRNSRVFIRSFTAITLAGTAAGLDIMEQSSVVFSNMTTITITGQDRACRVRGQSQLFVGAANPCTITATNNLRPALDIEENSEAVFSVDNVSFVCTGTGGGARVQTGSKLTVSSAAASFVASTNGPGVQCSGGSVCVFLGAAATTITGLGATGYGMNCRGGGQAYFSGAPTGVTGPLGDLTVGPGVGDTQANAFLAVSLSSLSAGPSAIARSA